MSAAESEPRRRSGPRRDEQARLAVLHAADDLLAEHGFGALTVEAIARRAGVAKQTIYRWWPSKVEILLDTLIEDTGTKLPVPDDDLRGYLRGFALFLTGDAAGKVLLALLAEAQHDARTAESLHQRYLEPRRVRERALLAKAGEVAPGLDPDAVLDALIGPIVYRALTGAEIPAGLVDALADAVLRSA
jgi:AcrR family transcriptional regulator